jgi:hypothetical protein
MTKSVIHLLQKIQVDDEQRERMLVTRCPPQFNRERCLKEPVVEASMGKRLSVVTGSVDEFIGPGQTLVTTFSSTTSVIGNCTDLPARPKGSVKKTTIVDGPRHTT